MYKKDIEQALNKITNANYKERVEYAAQGIIYCMTEIAQIKEISSEQKLQIAEMVKRPIISMAYTCDGPINVKEKYFLLDVINKSEKAFFDYEKENPTSYFSKQYNNEQITFFKNLYEDMFPQDFVAMLTIVFIAFASADGMFYSAEKSAINKLFKII